MASKARKTASYGYFATCPCCNQINYTNNLLAQSREKKCISCGEKIPRKRWNVVLEPRLGFITDKADVPDAPLLRPERDYRTDDYYVGDQHDVIKKMRFFFAGLEVEFQSTTNDSLVVKGSDKHTNCPICDWTIDAKTLLRAKHYTSWSAKWVYQDQGDECYLSHVLKTNVVQITFLQ